MIWSDGVAWAQTAAGASQGGPGLLVSLIPFVLIFLIFYFLLVVTALLTLAGYSLTDTVVVFDRIRENLRIRRRQPVDQVINSGINQVLSRTMITTLTIVLVLIPLTFFGGEVLHDFSLALLIGVLVGTYSSIFVASPILVVWKGSKGKLLSRA